MKAANNIDMRGARLLSAAGLTDASGNLTGASAYAQVATYADMMALGTPAVLTLVQVATDADKGGATYTEYHLWPNGTRRYMSSTSDQLVDYSGSGTFIQDNSGPWANDQSQSAEKSYDGNTATYYRSGTQNPYVGWNLGAAKPVSRFSLTPVQDGTNAPNLNGAQVQWSTDGSNWTNIGSAVSGVSSANYTTPVIINFTAKTAQYWRVLLTNYGWLAEFKVLFVRS